MVVLAVCDRRRRRCSRHSAGGHFNGIYEAMMRSRGEDPPNVAARSMLIYRRVSDLLILIFVIRIKFVRIKIYAAAHVKSSKWKIYAHTRQYLLRENTIKHSSLCACVTCVCDARR